MKRVVTLLTIGALSMVAVASMHVTSAQTAQNGSTPTSNIEMPAIVSKLSLPDYASVNDKVREILQAITAWFREYFDLTNIPHLVEGIVSALKYLLGLLARGIQWLIGML